MGISPSKRVSQTLSNSPEFNPSCDSVFQDSLSNTQFAFSGIKPYQLLSATQFLHHLLLPSTPLISRWVPSPPDRTQVDQAYQKVCNLRFSNPVQEDGVAVGKGKGKGEEVREGVRECLDREEFRVFALEVFSDVVVSKAKGEVVKMVPIGVVGIGGVGVVAKANGMLLGAAIGTYVLGVATTVYLGLGV